MKKPPSFAKPRGRKSHPSLLPPLPSPPPTAGASDSGPDQSTDSPSGSADGEGPASGGAPGGALAADLFPLSRHPPLQHHEEASQDAPRHPRDVQPRGPTTLKRGNQPGPHAGHSSFTAALPEVVYHQTSGPSAFDVALSPNITAALGSGAGHTLADVATASLRRFDLTPLLVYDEDAGEMAAFVPPPGSVAVLHGAAPGSLRVKLHRKHLPPSRHFGGCPLVVVVALKGQHHDELVVSTPFKVASQYKAPRPPPKRVRGPPPCRPFTSAAAGPETAINALLLGPAGGDDHHAKRPRIAAPSPADTVHVPSLASPASGSSEASDDDDNSSAGVGAPAAALPSPALPVFQGIDLPPLALPLPAAAEEGAAAHASSGGAAGVAEPPADFEALLLDALDPFELADVFDFDL